MSLTLGVLRLKFQGLCTRRWEDTGQDDTSDGLANQYNQKDNMWRCKG